MYTVYDPAVYKREMAGLRAQMRIIRDAMHHVNDHLARIDGVIA